MSVLLLSGGLDSLVLLAKEYHKKGTLPLCISFDYGQLHRRELNAALRIAEHYGAKRIIAKLPHLGGSALTGDDGVPKGLRWDDPGQAATVVPNRNLILLSVAASYAVANKESVVIFAAHAGDAAIYADCRPEFVAAADAAIRLACGVGVEAPFLSMTKRDIVTLGKELQAPLEMSWSCYMGGEEACGQCGACIERMEAMT